MKKLILLFVLLLFSSCENFSPEIADVSKDIDEVNNNKNAAYPTSIDYNESYPSYDNKSLLNVNSPTPEVSSGGLSTVHGRIFLKNNSNLPLKNTLLYLTPGKGENQSPPMILFGPETENGDYATLSDDNAYFSFKNIAPGAYYLVVSSTNSYSLVEVADEPFKIIVSVDQVINLDKQFVSLP